MFTDYASYRSYSSHSNNAKFGLALGGLALAGYGLLRALAWLAALG